MDVEIVGLENLPDKNDGKLYTFVSNHPLGGQIQVAGAVKNNKIRKTATSDWMDIEKQRGISVSTSVMEFDYLPDGSRNRDTTLFLLPSWSLIIFLMDRPVILTR